MKRLKTAFKRIKKPSSPPPLSSAAPVQQRSNELEPDVDYFRRETARRPASQVVAVDVEGRAVSTDPRQSVETIRPPSNYFPASRSASIPRNKSGSTVVRTRTNSASEELPPHFAPIPNERKILPAQLPKQSSGPRPSQSSDDISPRVFTPRSPLFNTRQSAYGAPPAPTSELPPLPLQAERHPKRDRSFFNSDSGSESDSLEKLSYRQKKIYSEKHKG